MNFLGFDFGTSNSLAGLARGSQIEFVNYPDGRTSNPTILYFPAKSKKYFVGSQAVTNYLADLDDEGTAGRLMLSIKSLLPDPNFDFTMVTGHGRQTAADLVARFLAAVKKLAEQQFSRKFEGVVLGRPVQFSELAVNRLEMAAKQAGFAEVVFWFEPVAAALAYEMTSTKDELVCVVDLGGGTSDVCIVETSPTRSAQADRLQDIKAVSGTYQAGDEMNSLIMNRKLAPRFGGGSTYHSLGKAMPFPNHIIYKLSRWHLINLLKTSADISTISSIVPSSDRPADVIRLLTLIKHHFGFQLFRAIDDAKTNLSAEHADMIKFRPLELAEEILRAEFEEMIAPVLGGITGSITEALVLAGVKAEAITRVILTGGSSQVPVIVKTVQAMFGREDHPAGLVRLRGQRVMSRCVAA